jgi:hypothetical protein
MINVRADYVSDADVPAFVIDRAFMYYGTSEIPDDVTVTAATLCVHVGCVQNGYVYVQEGTRADFPTVADYDAFTGGTWLDGTGKWYWDDDYSYESAAFNGTGMPSSVNGDQASSTDGDEEMIHIRTRYRRHTTVVVLMILCLALEACGQVSPSTITPLPTLYPNPPPYELPAFLSDVYPDPEEVVIQWSRPTRFIWAALYLEEIPDPGETLELEEIRERIEFMLDG